jgi:hypothetical protein
MSLIDIGALKNSVAKKINEEQFKKAEEALLKQMRAVEAAKAVLRAEELKLADIEQQIQDGQIR